MALLLGFMIYSVTTGGYAEKGASVWGKITEPFQKLSYSISEKVTSSIDMLVNAEKYYNDNKLLRAQLNQMYNNIIDYERVKQENEDLRAMLELSREYESFSFSPPCSVIARTTNDPFASFTIDKGSDDGIKPYDPVITSEGIVGVCYDVGSSVSRVRTLYSPKTVIGVYSLRTKAAGIIEGDTDAASKGCCLMKYIDKTADIAPGDIIITSGSANYPAEQLVGTVEQVCMEDSGLSMYAVIKPAVDPKTVSGVFAVTGFDVKPTAENGAASGDTERTRSVMAFGEDDAARAAEFDGDAKTETQSESTVSADGEGSP